MKITLCYSMQMAEKAADTKQELEKLGHTAFIVETNKKFVGKTNEEKEEIKLQQKFNNDAINEHFKLIENSDAILVLNYEKNGVANYIGGNTFLETGLAYYLKKPIYLINPIPKISYETEIIAIKPIILNGDLTKIK